MCGVWNFGQKCHQQAVDDHVVEAVKQIPYFMEFVIWEKGGHQKFTDFDDLNLKFVLFSVDNGNAFI